MHEGKGNFVTNIQQDGEVEMFVILGELTGKLKDYGGIVFEMFYRADLDMYM